ncbi:hypothetical protein BYT27DRAFT_7208184 [Phlegmacium glaucopus]|nr:hypothetical protein BYT27DRAFT_7208184 [Phlegmacium glaucopus]
MGTLLLSVVVLSILCFHHVISEKSSAMASSSNATVVGLSTLGYPLAPPVLPLQSVWWILSLCLYSSIEISPCSSHAAPPICLVDTLTSHAGVASTLHLSIEISPYSSCAAPPIRLVDTLTTHAGVASTLHPSIEISPYTSRAALPIRQVESSTSTVNVLKLHVQSPEVNSSVLRHVVWYEDIIA